MSKRIVFIDSSIADYQTLIDGLEPGSEYYLIDAGSDGLAQIAASLQGRTGIDALHIISHGSQGALTLGSTVLDSSNLADYQSQLAAIGSSLAATGDILLYGCNVAQAEAGQAFINSLAQATGADVAASTDLTGAAQQGGDWVLEAASSPVETPALNLDQVAYDHTLGTTTETLAFNVNDANLWQAGTGFSYSNSFENFVFPLSDFNLSNIVGSGTFGLDYGLSLTNVKFGVPIEVGLSSGVFDLSYSVKAQIGIPSVVQSGGSFTVQTSSGVAANPSMVIDGPGAQLSASAIFEGDVGSHLGATWDTSLGDGYVALIGSATETAEGVVFSDSTQHIDISQQLFSLAACRT